MTSETGKRKNDQGRGNEDDDWRQTLELNNSVFISYEFTSLTSINKIDDKTFSYYLLRSLSVDFLDLIGRNTILNLAFINVNLANKHLVLELNFLPE